MAHNKTPEARQVFVSDRDAIDIISPRNNRRVAITIKPDGTVQTVVERLDVGREQRLMGEINFSRVTRNLICASMALDAAKLSPGSEDISPEMDVLDYQKQFSVAVAGLAKDGYSDRDLQRFIIGEARQIAGGEVRMGEIPPVVKGVVGSLNKQVSNYFLTESRSLG